METNIIFQKILGDNLTIFLKKFRKFCNILKVHGDNCPSPTPARAKPWVCGFMYVR